jgi:polyisoprenyl-teichoic acid--peptidoglycan teichoic acid transferase
VKTSDELWRWIWDDDNVLDDDVLADLFGEPETGSPPPPPPPKVRREDLWEWVSGDEPLLDADPLGEPDLAPAPTGPVSPDEPVPAPTPPPVGEPVEAVATPPEPTASPATVPQPTEAPPSIPEPAEAPAPLPEPEPSWAAPDRSAEVARRHRPWGRHVRFASLVLVATAVGAVAPQVTPTVLRDDGSGSPAPVAPEQTVVVWSVLDDARGLAFVAVMAAGARPPVTLAVPAEVTINVPGHGLGTVREAAVTGERGLVGVAVENLLGVPVDAVLAMRAEELAAAVDAAGPIVVADQPMDGAAVVAYLTSPEIGDLPDERFLRWQDVLDGLLDATEARPEAATPFPDPLNAVLAASSPERADLLALPVIELGAGLLRPDEDGIGRMVTERFLPKPGDEVRLVVLNGVGEPGVGEEVARILIPNGFNVVSSGNANRFDLRVTRVIATSEEDLPAAERARDLLGAGQILLGAEPQLADVIVVVGRDFAGGR